MWSRSFNSSSYRYGFIGAENDDEISGDGNSQNHTFRQYNPRLGRYMSLDPLAIDYPWNSPYSYAENDVIRSIDLEGRERYIMITNLATETTTQVELETEGELGEGILYVTQNQHGLSSTFQAPIDIDNLGNVTGGEITRIPISNLDNKTKGVLLNYSSPLSMGAKKTIMRDLSTPNLELSLDQIRLGADILDYGGLGAEIVGYGATVLGAPEIGIPLSRGGAIVSGIGSGIKATLDIAEGDHTGALIEGVGMGVGKVADVGLNSVKVLNPGAKSILKQNIDLKINFGGKLIEEKVNQEKDE